MGSCTTKQRRLPNSQKFLSVTDAKLVKEGKSSSFLNPEIRAKILHAKDAKAPILKLRENQLLRLRMTQLQIQVAPEIQVL